MKFTGHREGALEFLLEPGEKTVLLAVLSLYPRIPPAHHRLTRSTKASATDPNQKLLDEALGEQRRDNKRLLRGFLKDPARFSDTETGCHLRLSATDVEWFLQILNDVRVGSWVLLGSPDYAVEPLKVTEETRGHVSAMELAGYFESRLLEVLHSPPSA